MKKPILLLLLSTSLCATSFASTYSFGGACGSKGSWTKAALNQGQVIIEAVNQLKDDPNCRGIESIVPQLELDYLDAKSGNGGEFAGKWDHLPQEMASLREAMGSEGGRVDVMNALMGKTIENAGLSSSVEELKLRSQLTIKNTMNLLDKTMEILPNYDQCLYGHPNQAAAIFGATLKVAASVVSSGETLPTNIGDTVAGLVNYMRESRFSKVLRDLNESEYWTSLSCLIETTTEAYCSVKDAYELQDMSYQSEVLRRELSEEGVENPLEGYYIMTREIPIVSAWVQKVQFGVDPRLKMDASFKNVILDNVNNLDKTRILLLSAYADSMQVMTSLTDVQAKRNHIFKMIEELTRMLSESSFNKDMINFFTMSVFKEKIPFFLIGRDMIPKECSAREDGGFVMKWSMYMQNGGRFIGEFADPDALALTVGSQLTTLIENAMKNGSAYYQQRLIVDMRNLVDKSISDQGITVFDALGRIDRYLGKLAKRLINNTTEAAILPSILDTKQRVEKVLRSYQVVEDMIAEYYAGRAIVTERTEIAKLNKALASSEDVKKAYAGILETAYSEFNVLFQRDTFLMTRVGTFVRFDYADHIKNSNDMSEYQKELLVVAGQNMMARITGSHLSNPADVQLDLNSAQVINRRNLDVVEEMFSDALIPVIAELEMIASGEGNSNLKRNWDTVKRYYRDSRSSDPLDLLFVEGTDVGLDDKFMNIWNSLPVVRFINLSVNYFGDSDRYDLHFSMRRVETHDDMYRSFDKFKSRFCIQTLAFSDKGKFYELCKGSKLESFFELENDDVQLDLTYNNLIKEFVKNKRIGSRQEIRENRDENICAYRNFRRKNLAYSMLKQFE